ncbi:hypothetical protein PM8797T_06937 [Gimesia maris DSM 8797]|nr:hypothetical protein PM8797T_06937 [Gimesia maris DSM 8797]
MESPIIKPDLFGQSEEISCVLFLFSMTA